MRRLFWVSAGAVLGATGYRRVTPAGARGRRGRAAATAPRSGSGVPGALARGAARFARDVRDGMELYTDRHPGLAGRTLEGQQARARRPAGEGRGRAHPGTDYAKDGR